jgi:hypothetical protein
MQTSHGHLCYCTNIHPGETWTEHFAEIRASVPLVSSTVSDGKPFGLGLRLSANACFDLAQDKNLQEFKEWLEESDSYVFTMNGFPYGNFSGSPVKQLVHKPDWRTAERREYTIALFDILAQLLPEGLEGSISTSPLSYRHWFKDERSMREGFEKTTQNILEVVAHLANIYQRSGKILHLNPEPEPCGLLENTAEFIQWYNEYYIPMGIVFMKKKVKENAEEHLRRHLRLCYDVCHSALAYENIQEVQSALKSNGILTGKVQLSSALSIDLRHNRIEKLKSLWQFNEPVYLHQVVARDAHQNLHRYKDLPEAVYALQNRELVECRIHFHVPVFSENYELFSSTQDDIVQTLSSPDISTHWEVETYTWNVLPKGLQAPLADSISRELNWVISNMKKEPGHE